MQRRKSIPSQADSQSASPRIRCGIYTRKSTDEGLDQLFNSLDAQREACANYVASQQQEGWSLVPERYDDGGFSGGSMARPSLQRLLADIKDGKVDVIVVYKVDRLTRSLADFGKIVDVLDAVNASFVSVTQAFNTTNSMGRLTLNVLLSFAQFEREVTSERIRDKIAASKRKGMWTGGRVPLGYTVCERKLEIDVTEATAIKLIFELHQELGTLSGLADALHHRNVKSKVRCLRDGTVITGHRLSPGPLRHILRNRLYIGEVCHLGQTYPGVHEGIVERAVWEKSQELLDRTGPRARTGHPNALTGRIRDEDGNRLLAAHTIKGIKRYRYYVSATRDSAGCWRLPSGDIEAIVIKAISRLFQDPARLTRELGMEPHAARMADCNSQIVLAEHDPRKLGALLKMLAASIVVEKTAVCTFIERGALAKMLAIELPDGSPTEPIAIETLANLRMRGNELRLVFPKSTDEIVHLDKGLIELLSKGWAAWERLSKGPWITDAPQRSHLTRLARLRFLAPDIATAILKGRQPVELTSRSLLRISELPLSWHGQRMALGFR